MAITGTNAGIELAYAAALAAEFAIPKMARDTGDATLIDEGHELARLIKEFTERCAKEKVRQQMDQ